MIGLWYFYSDLFLASRFAFLAAFFSLGDFKGVVLSDFRLPSFSLDIDLIFS